jgi:hypothetical protein
MTSKWGTIVCVISTILTDLEVVDRLGKLIILFVLVVVTFRECGSWLGRIQSVVLLVVRHDVETPGFSAASHR